MKILTQQGGQSQKIPQSLPLAHPLPERLEQYLKEVEADLQGVPPELRQVELLEIRAHLKALVEAEEERGASSEQAALLALEQFGPAQEFTRKLTQTLRRQNPSLSLQISLLALFSMLAMLIILVGQVLVDRGYSWSFELLSVGITPMVLGGIWGRRHLRAEFVYLILGLVGIIVFLIKSMVRLKAEDFNWILADYSRFQQILEVGINWSLLSTNHYWHYLNAFVIFMVVGYTAYVLAKNSSRVKASSAFAIPDRWYCGFTLAYIIPMTMMVARSSLGNLGVGTWKRWALEQAGQTALGDLLAWLYPQGLTWLVAGWVVGRLCPRQGGTGIVALILTQALLLPFVPPQSFSVLVQTNAWTLCALFLTYFLGRRSHANH